MTAWLFAIVLTWTAPGDDGIVGTATAYDLRYARDSVTVKAWTSATQAAGEPVPHAAGAKETFSFAPGPGTWWIAVRTRDEAGNLSALSNIISRTEGDTSGPCLIVVEGDLNGSGNVNSADVILLMNYCFRGQAQPSPCPASGDLNCSGSVTAGDIVTLVSFCFKSAALPCDICTESPLPCT